MESFQIHHLATISETDDAANKVLDDEVSNQSLSMNKSQRASKNSKNVRLPDESNSREHKTLLDVDNHSPTSSFTDKMPPGSSLQNRSKKNRPSVLSRKSIETFFNELPKNDHAFVDQEFYNTFTNLIHAVPDSKTKRSLKEKIKYFVESKKFNLALIILVVIDIICVVVAVVVDILHKDIHSHALHLVEEVAEIISMIVLSIFLITFIVQIILEPKDFFRRKLEIIDAVIVIISFGLEIFLLVKKKTLHAIEIAVITFRFWRVIRIVLTIVVAVEKHVYEKLKLLEENIKVILSENDEMATQIQKKDKEIEYLHAKLEDPNLIKLEKHRKETFMKEDNFEKWVDNL